MASLMGAARAMRRQELMAEASTGLLMASWVRERCWVLAAPGLVPVWRQAWREIGDHVDRGREA